MKPSVELFKLINSLSKSEKRFFKLSSSLQSGDKNYLKLFDYIEKQTDYDEEALKVHFKKEIFIKHLPSEKNHLYKLILKSLRSYYSEHSVSNLLKQEIKNIEILYSKALYKECEKFLQRAKKLAYEYEKFYYLFELISWEKKLMEEAQAEGEFHFDLDSLVKEEEDVISKLRNLAEYQIIYSKINLIFRTGGFTRSEKEQEVVDSIADYHLIKGKNTALSTRAATICYYIKGLCAATNRNYSDSYLFFNKTREIIDRTPHLKPDLAQRYVMTLSHLLRTYIDTNDFASAERLITDLRNLAGKKGFSSTDVLVRINTNTYNQELVMYHKKGKFHESVELIPKIEAIQSEFVDKISKEQLLLFNYNKAYSYFGIGDYKKALFHLNEVLNDNEQNLRKDVYSISRVLNLVVHYELENYEFLDYVIKSTNRYLSKHSRDYQIENTVIKNLKKLAKTHNMNERIDLLMQMKSEVTIHLKDHHESALLEYFDISAWMDSKINRTAFKDEVVKQLLAKKQS